MARGKKPKQPRVAGRGSSVPRPPDRTPAPGAPRRGLGEQLVKVSKRAERSTGRAAATHPNSGPNQYSGFRSQPGVLEHVKPRNLSPEQFWKTYVSTRRPVVISGHLSDQDWKASSRWTNQYLIDTAGHVSVKVEVRSNDSDTFGRDRKKVMRFAEFVRLAAAGDSSLYLTTQAVATAPDKFPELHAQPVTALAADFPERPSLLGQLVPQNINLWMGCSPSGSSSGLHHDFHDNLYILIRGQKLFRLYSPDTASRMALHGLLKRVHANGRIVYKEDGDLRADGASEADAADWERQRAAAAYLKDASNTANGSDAEDELEAVLDSMLDHALEYGDDDLGQVDDYGPDDSDAGEEPEPIGEPPSFSKIDMRQSDADIMQEFPCFPGKASALVAELKAGDMLYLPAGWFHEVTSVGEADDGGHMALNYWMHPPDNLDPGPAGFASPYTHSLWPSLYQQRQAAARQPEGSAQATASPPLAEEQTADEPPEPRNTKGAKISVTRPQKTKERKSKERRSLAGAESVPNKKLRKKAEMPMWGSWFGAGSSKQQAQQGFSEEDQLLDALANQQI